MTSRGTALSQQIKGEPAVFRGLQVVAVVMEPLPDHYRLVVREVGNAFDGADYVAPETPSEPPAPIEPSPPILQWKGNSFYAIPGFNHSVSEFADTWFSDILRDDQGAPILADGNPIEQLPDDTTIFRWLLLRTEGPPMLFPMGGAQSATQQFRIIGIANGYVIAKKWTSETRTAGTSTIIWMPWTLRVSEEPYTDSRGRTYERVGPQERIQRLPSGAYEEQVINPPYHGEPAGDIIYGMFAPSGGIASHHPDDDYGEVPLTSRWIDVNVDGRQWARKHGT
jgi:hypothetical protein